MSTRASAAISPGATSPTVGASPGHPWTEQMSRKMLRNVEKRGVHAARNGPSEDRKCWQRVELGTQWTEQMSRKMLRNVEIRGVQAASNGPSLPPYVANAEIRTA